MNRETRVLRIVAFKDGTPITRASLRCPESMRVYLRGLEKGGRMDELVEVLAALEHEQWMQWSQSITKTEKLSPERLARWEELWIPYADLPDDQKEHDRVWARKTLRAAGLL